MNNSIINIEGIHADSQAVSLEHSTDMAQLLTIKDEWGNKVFITIINGKITESKLDKLTAAR